MNSDDFTHNFVADGLNRLYRSASMAGWAFITQHMLNAFSGALTRHFHQPQLRETVNAGFHAILTQRLLQ